MSDSSSYSEDSDSSSDELSQDFLDSEEFGIRPYQFEPEIEISSDSQSNEDSESGDDETVEDDEEHNRLTNSDW